MYTGYVVKAGVIAEDARVAQAIKNFRYENEGCICVGKRGRITEINTFWTVCDMFDTDFETPEDALEAYLAMKNAPAAEA